MRGRIPLHGDEEDALTRAKRFYLWRPGRRKEIKRGYNKRARKAGKRDVGNE